MNLGSPEGRCDRGKKRTYFGAHPCPKKGANSKEFREYVRSYVLSCRKLCRVKELALY